MGQLLKVHRICSYEVNFEQGMMCQLFFQWGYFKQVVSREFGIAKAISGNTWLENRNDYMKHLSIPVFSTPYSL